MYSVAVQPPAYRDIERTYRWLRTEAGPERARTWRAELADALHSLAEFPQRCPIAPEAQGLQPPVHQLLHQSHRILFTIAGQEVRILHVRHTARGPWKP